MRHRTMALSALTVTLTSVIFALGVGAHPTYVQCDRTTRTSSGATGSDVAQRSSIMGMTVQTSTTAIVSAPAVASYNASTTVTLTLSGLGTGAFLHATAGTVSGLSSPWSSAPCVAASLHTKSSSGSSYVASWMAPSDVSNILNVEITLGSSNGNAEVTMQKLTLNRDSNWDASPTPSATPSPNAPSPNTYGSGPSPSRYASSPSPSRGLSLVASLGLVSCLVLVPI